MIGSELLIKNIITEILFNKRICESREDHLIVTYIYHKLYEARLLYGEPITVPELRKLLHDKIVNFEFVKIDGTIRPAKGTTRMDYIPQTQHPKGIRHSSPKVATFYDLKKQDWRSVSQRSKEIVLKKDEETGKPIVMVKDKPKGDVAVKNEKPIASIDGKPIEEPKIQEPEEEKPEVSKIKPIERGEGEERFYLSNPVSGATMIIELSPKDLIKKLKELGKDWKLVTKDEYEEKEEQISTSAEKEPIEKIEDKEPSEKETKSSIEDIKDREEDRLENIPADEV